MRLRDGVQLTYCTNIHPAHDWPTTRRSVLEHAPVVKEQVCPDRPMGVGLRLSAQAARQLANPDELARFCDELEAAGLYVFTLNGFPYGPFHGTPVKISVYRPDWTESERVEYTRALAHIATVLVPRGPEPHHGSISTVPVGFAPAIDDAGEARAVEHLIDVAVQLVDIAQRGGPQLVLALEPEPHCHLETVEQTVDFFTTRLWAPRTVERLRSATGLDLEGAAEALRRHVGVCFDTCHAAVEFEDPRAALRRLVETGIRIGKIQVTAGLEVRPVDRSSLERLRRFCDDVYLHQVVARQGNRLTRFLDLPPALEAIASGRLAPEVLRVHFHVPVFTPRYETFSNTASFAATVLDEAAKLGVDQHLEVETYTWDVLPASLRTLDLDQAIAREMTWVGEQATRSSG